MAGPKGSVLLPSQFMPRVQDPLPPGVSDGEAYKELVANYAAFKAKVNKLLARCVDTIRHSAIVDLRRNYIGAVGLQAVTSLLVKNENLEELFLPCSGLSNDSVVFLCRAMTKHPKLRRMDLSSNDISLAAGLALLSLLQQNPRIVSVDLNETHMPESIMKKIEQVLMRNTEMDRLQPPRPLSTRQQSTTDSFLETVEEEGASTIQQNNGSTGSRCPGGGFVSAIRETVRKAEWEQREVTALRRLEAVFQSEVEKRSKFVPSPHIESGWRLIEVAILSPPFIFQSEIELLVSEIFPRLNAELLRCKVQLIPLFNPPDGPAGTCLRKLRFAISADLLRDVDKSRLLAVELIGDRAGDYRQLPANEMITRPHLIMSLKQAQSEVPTIPWESAEAPPLYPVLYEAHQRASEVSSWLIVATRKSTRRIGMPPSLAPLLSEEPHVEHPDYLQREVRRTCAIDGDAVCSTQCIMADAKVKEQKWHEHQQHCQSVLEGMEVPELVIQDYHAVFDNCTADGQICLKELGEFSEAMYQRMRLLMQTHFPASTDGHPTFFSGKGDKEKVARKLKLLQERMRALLLTCHEFTVMKKNITSRLDLYIIAPPSRNSLLLHGTETITMTHLVGSFTHTLMSKNSPRYRIAYHTTRSLLLSDEPTDLRDIVCNIMLQLFPDQEVYREAIGEVDMYRLQKLFSDVLSEKVKTTEARNTSVAKVDGTDGVTTIVIIDGLDSVEPCVEPCAALRNSEDTGKDVWGTPPVKTSSFSYIPYCLSRNVRLVLCADSDSSLCSHMATRGHDSVELLPMGPITPNDFDEMLHPNVLSKVGVTVSDDDFMLIRKREDALSPEYVALVVDVLRSFNEVPGVETQSVKLSLPGTVKGMVERVYAGLQECFGGVLIKKCTRLLMCSRWGIYEPQLRAMLQLPQARFNRLLRMMRPLLYSENAVEIGAHSGNALNYRVCIRSRCFREILNREEVQEAKSEEDQKVWHGILTHCYLGLVNEAIRRENQQPILGLISTSPYERTAVKELPYHAVKAEEFDIIHSIVLSMPFLMVAYRNTLGYHIVRELIEAFNVFYESYELGEYKECGAVCIDQKPFSILRLRDYIYFLRQYNAILTRFPYLLLQTAVESSHLHPYVSNDAKVYIRRLLNPSSPLPLRRLVFFSLTGTVVKKQIHHGSVNACCFTPRSKRLITASSDHSICSVNPVTGAPVVQVRRAPASIVSLICCETGSYHAAVCYDRTLHIYDSAQMQLVSRCDGGTFGAPLASVAFSARGRYYLVATEDLHLRVYETERSQELLHIDQRKHLGESNVPDINLICGFTAVIPDRFDDDVFYSTCHSIVLMWQRNPARDEFHLVKRFNAPFTVSTGKMMLTGEHFLFHPAQHGPKQDEQFLSTRNLRLCSTRTGKEIAVLTSPGGQALYELSANEKLVASALYDGTIVIHRIPWGRLKHEEGEVLRLAPVNHFKAFKYSAVPIVKGLRFKSDGKGLFALGNRTQMKFWVLPRRPRAVEPNLDASGGQLQPQEEIEEEEEQEQEEEEENEILEGVADGEYVHEAFDVTAWDVIPDSNANGAEVVFGEQSGRVTLLRLWFPLT
ncbi:hypothetical protein TRVL_00368 [Trypanosoma vivax]|nr:hypothetical protein TRVL_00368 [Trypanosoma vivax]